MTFFLAKLIQRIIKHVIQFPQCLNFAHICCNEYPSKCCIPDTRLSQIPEESATPELPGKGQAWGGGESDGYSFVLKPFCLKFS